MDKRVNMLSQTTPGQEIFTPWDVLVLIVQGVMWVPQFLGWPLTVLLLLILAWQMIWPERRRR